MNIERNLKIICLAKRLADLAEEAHDELVAHVAAGNEIPGWVVGVKRSRKREFISESHAAKVLAERGVPNEMLFETRMRTLPQLERLLPREILEDLWCHPVRGCEVMPDSWDVEVAEFAK